jgi:predicted dehydrogenase
MDRRNFIRSSASTSIAVSSVSLYERALEARSVGANDRIRIGMVGTHGRAGALMRVFAGQKDVDVVALADVDTRYHDAAVEAVKNIAGNTPRVYTDFRHIIDDDSIDAVVVGTPDHWHAIPTIMACQAGKDVYVEKPDGHNILEGQTMVKAMKKHGRIVQLGTQARTTEHFQQAIDWIAEGHLGKVLVAKAWESSRQGNIGKPDDSEPPAGVNYDMWLGPAPKRDFNPRRFHGNWRWFYDYGTGDLGNDGVHRIDVARWALDTAGKAQGMEPLYMPTRISALGGKWYFDDLQEWPDSLQVTYEYGDRNSDAPGRLLTYEMRLWAPYRYNDETEGVILYGDKGYIMFGNRRWRAFSGDGKLVAQGAGQNTGTSHMRNFLDCMRSRKKPNADLETVGHPSSILCHSANVSWRIGRQVTLDPTTELFVGDAEANKYRTRPVYRKPWELPTV